MDGGWDRKSARRAASRPLCLSRTSLIPPLSKPRRARKTGARPTSRAAPQQPLAADRSRALPRVRRAVVQARGGDASPPLSYFSSPSSAGSPGCARTASNPRPATHPAADPKSHHPRKWKPQTLHMPPGGRQFQRRALNGPSCPWRRRRRGCGARRGPSGPACGVP